MAGSPAAPQLSLRFTGEGPGGDPAAGEMLLRDVTFVVVDLETTGGRSTPGPDGAFDTITEIGAVKVRGGEVIGEFATLVDPERSIPPQIVEYVCETTFQIVQDRVASFSFRGNSCY